MSFCWAEGLATSFRNYITQNITTSETMTIRTVPEDLFAFLHNYSLPDWPSEEVYAKCEYRFYIIFNQEIPKLVNILKIPWYFFLQIIKHELVI